MWAYEHDSNHRLTSYTDPEGEVTGYRYDAAGRLDQITDPRGNTTEFGYDSADRVTSVTRVIDGTTAGDVTTTYAYSAASAPCAAGNAGTTVVTDPRGYDTTYCADGTDQIVRVRNAKGHDADRSYTPNGDTDLFTELAGTANAEITDLTFATSGSDPTNNLTGGQVGPQEPFALGYCGGSGLPSCSSSDPLDRYRPRSFTDEQGADQVYGYDTAGNLTDVKDDATSPRNQATLTYNSDGTLATATDGEGSQTTLEYFASPAVQAGNLKKVTPPLPLGVTEYTYDALGRVDVITDPRGNTFDYTYDKLDRVSRISGVGGWSFDYTYDANGNVIERAASDKGSTLYEYDELNRTTEETFPGSRINEYTYDKSSNLTVLTDNRADSLPYVSTVTYSYDQIDRVSAIVAPNATDTGTDTITYTYQDTPSSGPRAVVETFPGGATQRVELDTAGKPTEILVADASGSPLSTLTYDYSELVGSSSKQRALIQSITDQVGTGTAYTYTDTVEDVGRLLKARTTTNTGALVREWRYGYDKVGNRTRRVEETPSSTATTSYAYNAANQLCWSHTGTSANACTSPPAGATSFSYDAAGNQLTGSYTFSYDYWGRAKSINGDNQGYAGPTHAELIGDGAAHYQNNLLGLGHQSIGTSSIYWQRNPDTGHVVSPIGSGEKRYYLRDHLGSTTGLLDPANGGSIARSYSYDPDGNDTTAGTGTDTDIRYADGHRLWFGGHRLNGVYHFGARHYDTSTARWTRLDPLNQVADLRQANRYTYVGGDPINLTDPSGMSWIGDALEIGGAVAATAIVCGTAASGLTAGICVAGLTATTGLIANKAEGWGKARRRGGE